VKQFSSVAALAAVMGFAASSALARIEIPTVAIENLDNAADPTTGYGSVGHTYNIGNTEVSNWQYVAFLSAVAATDTNDLHSTSMAGPFGGITRSGTPGSYTYATISGRANYPVNSVSFWDSTRFANWLHNGQPTGQQNNSTTEDGAYTLTADGISGNAITRNANWQWAVTSEDEWYKAAYHQPAIQGGDSDNYWLYPTASNTITTAQANYDNVIGNTTPAGSYAANFYSTFEMGGNNWEWTEAIISGSGRGLRGGSLSSNGSTLRADFRYASAATNDFNSFGFRVVQVPGPTSIALLAIGGVLAGRRRRN